MQTPPSGISGPRCKGHGKGSVQRNVTKGKNAGRWGQLNLQMHVQAEALLHILHHMLPLSQAPTPAHCCGGLHLCWTIVH